MGAAAGGIGQAFSGGVELFSSMDEANANAVASQRQFVRERRQADTAIQGALEKGAYASGKARIATSELNAQQKAAYAASGVDPTQGTAAAVQADTAALGEHDAQQLAINAAKEAWGFKVAGQQAVEESEARNAGIDRKRTAGMLGGFSKYASGVLSSGMGGGG